MAELNSPRPQPSTIKATCEIVLKAITDLMSCRLSPERPAKQEVIRPRLAMTSIELGALPNSSWLRRSR